MLSVSNPALQQLHGSLPESTHANKCFRIMPKDETNLTLKFMEVEESDTTFEYQERTVLALPKDLAPLCKNKRLDVNDEGQLELA
jgi:hypothetical protein